MAFIGSTGDIFEAPREKGVSEWRSFGIYKDKLVARAVADKPLAKREGRAGYRDLPFNLLLLKRLYPSH
jgi:hypothetical protein